MRETLTFHTYDVFTERLYSGNPLAIVEGAGALSDAQMLAMAREFNLSETIFVMAPRDPAHDARVRIFFPTAEVPFAGHPTLGCAVYLAEARHGTGDFDARIVLEEEAGIVPVELSRRGGVTRGWFTAPVVPHAAPGTVPAGLPARALGLPEAAVGFGAHRAGLWQGGPGFLYVPVRDREALAAALPREPLWSELMAAGGVDSAYVYTPGQDGADWQARMFSPGGGIPEDPATGSATAILAAPLLEAGALAEGVTELRLAQGLEMGRPSALGLRITVASGALARVQVGGAAVRVSEGRIRPPAD